jgi:hypothetical protein
LSPFATDGSGIFKINPQDVTVSFAKRRYLCGGYFVRNWSPSPKRRVHGMGIYQTVLDQWGIPYDAPLPLLQRPQARDRLIKRKPLL